MERKKIVIFCPYPYNQAPSQRFRYEQYLQFLQESGFSLEILSFLDEKTNKTLYKKGHFIQKVLGVVLGFFKRSLHVLKSFDADFVFIHREATPLGPPVFEWLLAKVMGKKIIYDFDDAIWLPNTSAQNKIAAHLKWHHKVQSISQWAYKISAGNAYLCQNAISFRQGKAEGVVLNPTTIDTLMMHNRLRNQKEGKLVIGWTGSHSTLVYLNEIVPLIERLEKEFDFHFRVICNHNPNFNLKSFEFVPWKEATEIDDLLALHIGIMPLTEDAWSEGKCGFKALQYMALGIPAVISPVGVNKIIVDEGINGFLCKNQEEWYEKLKFLIENSSEREKMGLLARQKIENHYSVLSNKKNFLSLFE